MSKPKKRKEVKVPAFEWPPRGIQGVDVYEIKNKATEDPVWLLQRQPNLDKRETNIQIWVKDDAMKVSSVELAQLLANVIQAQVNQ